MVYYLFMISSSERAMKQRKAKEILGEGCGRLDGSNCLEIGTNSRRSADVRKSHQGSNIRKRISESDKVWQRTRERTCHRVTQNMYCTMPVKLQNIFQRQVLAEIKGSYQVL